MFELQRAIWRSRAGLLYKNLWHYERLTIKCIRGPYGEVATRRSAKPLWAGATPAVASRKKAQSFDCAFWSLHPSAARGGLRCKTNRHYGLNSRCGLNKSKTHLSVRFVLIASQVVDALAVLLAVVDLKVHIRQELHCCMLFDVVTKIRSAATGKV